MILELSEISYTQIFKCIADDQAQRQIVKYDFAHAFAQKPNFKQSTMSTTQLKYNISFQFYCSMGLFTCAHKVILQFCSKYVQITYYVFSFLLFVTLIRYFFQIRKMMVNQFIILVGRFLVQIENIKYYEKYFSIEKFNFSQHLLNF